MARAQRCLTMPIKPENRARYPVDWPAIRERILQRASNCCEHPDCGARNYDVGYWRKQMGRFVWFEQVRGLRSWREASQRAAELYFAAGEEGPRPTVIVLTIAHLDHQPENCDPANLRALCQRHHLAHDHDHHRASAQATRRGRLAIADLF